MGAQVLRAMVANMGPMMATVAELFMNIVRKAQRKYTAARIPMGP